jgi:hypothetical protein
MAHGYGQVQIDETQQKGKVKILGMTHSLPGN